MMGLGRLAEAVAHDPREIKRHSYKTPEAAAKFFCDCKAQGFYPALIQVSDGWEVTVWA